MKKMVIGVSIVLLLTGCHVPENYIKDNQKADIESSVDQKTVYTYIKKAKAHLSTAPNYNSADFEDRFMKMASDSFQLSVNEVTEIYTAYEYNE